MQINTDLVLNGRILSQWEQDNAVVKFHHLILTTTPNKDGQTDQELPGHKNQKLVLFDPHVSVEVPASVEHQIKST